MIVELMKDFTGIRHDVRVSGVEDPERGWVEGREGTGGAMQWR